MEEKKKKQTSSFKKESLKDNSQLDSDAEGIVETTSKNYPRDKQGEKESYQLASMIAKFLSEKKCNDIVIVNLGGKAVIADYFVIAVVNSTTAVKALTDYVDEKLSKDYDIEPLRRDIGVKWNAIDYSSVILHIQHEEIKDTYDIASLWNDGTNVEQYKG